MIKKIAGSILYLTLLPSLVWAHEGHEEVAVHWTQIPWGFKGAIEAVNIHPLLVHFPIALLLTAAVFYFLGILLKKEQPLMAGRWVLVCGAIAAGLAVWTGLQAAGTVPHGGETHGIMMVHQYFGYGIFGLSVCLSLWTLFSKANLPQKGRPVFLILLLVLAGLIAQGADLGGRLVFQQGVGVGKKSMSQPGASHEHQGHAEHAQHAEEGHGH